MSKMKQVKHNIMRLYSIDRSVADNYNKLIMSYWQTIDGAFFSHQVEGATPAESITRAFRDLVSQGQIQVSRRVREGRDEQQRLFHDEFAAIR